jgi:hypothetical protein
LSPRALEQYRLAERFEAERGKLRALTFTIDGDRIAGYEVIADPVRLRGLDLAVLDC